MASEEMDRELTRVKNAIKKLSAKGGVKIASEVWDVNEALAAYQAAVEEVLKRYEDVAQEAADEEALARLNYDLAHRRLEGGAGCLLRCGSGSRGRGCFPELQRSFLSPARLPGSEFRLCPPALRSFL